MEIKILGINMNAFTGASTCNSNRTSVCIMVRIKTRWFLVRVDYADAMNIKNDDKECFPSKNELARVVRDNLTQYFGIALSGAAQDTQVRFCDSNVRLVLIRVPREYCQVIRASITFLTEIQNNIVVVSTISVKASARTAKIDALKQIQYFYRLRLSKLIKKEDNTTGGRITNNTRKEIDRLCQAMDETIDAITNIDY